jgi:outer membrane protein OmpA-like peptidoglycan-associated protein
MDQMRLTLAVLAALLALVFLGVWFAKGRQHSKKRGAVLLYSVLLFASAAVLYLGSKSEQEPAKQQITRDESSRKNPKVEEADSKDSSPEKAEVTSTTEAAPSKVSTVPANPKSAEIWKNQNSQSSSHGSVELSYGDTKSRKPKLKTSSGALPKSSKPKSDNRPAEEIIETEVLSAFDAIEIFFETYGAPVAAQASFSGVRKPSGTIEFVNGTSELSEPSRKYLHTLAAQLEQMYEHGQLEIRAQSNEKVDSPAHRYLLTQSRAEAVRDVLAQSGFPADRLVPVGTEEAGETRVKFVHRPN